MNPKTFNLFHGILVITQPYQPKAIQFTRMPVKVNSLLN